MAHRLNINTTKYCQPKKGWLIVSRDWSEIETGPQLREFENGLGWDILVTNPLHIYNTKKTSIWKKLFFKHPSIWQKVEGLIQLLNFSSTFTFKFKKDEFPVETSSSRIRNRLFLHFVKKMNDDWALYLMSSSYIHYYYSVFLHLTSSGFEYFCRNLTYLQITKIGSWWLSSVS